MSINGSAEYKSAKAFRTALDARLKATARAERRPVTELKRAFLFQRLLALVFNDPATPWLLKGGAGLLVRIPGARHSQDVDLVHLDRPDVTQAVTELRALLTGEPDDHVRFTVPAKVRVSEQNQVASVNVVVDCFGKYDEFKVDLAVQTSLIVAPERITPTAVLDVPGLPDVPAITLYSLPDQVADKLCSMYERHGTAGHPSNRYRDLYDLALIVSTHQLVAEDLTKAIVAEAEARDLQLVVPLPSPDPTWEAGYARFVRDQIGVRSSRGALDRALAEVGECINPILDGAQTSGAWRPGEGWL